MSNLKQIWIVDDYITRRTPAEWGDGLITYEYTGAPRSDQFSLWFRHPDNDVLFYALQGSFAFESNNDPSPQENRPDKSASFIVHKDGFVQVPAGSAYRFRNATRDPVRALLTVADAQAESSWRSVAAELQQVALRRCANTFRR